MNVENKRRLSASVFFPVFDLLSVVTLENVAFSNWGFAQVNPDVKTAAGYVVSGTLVRVEGNWTDDDLMQLLLPSKRGLPLRQL